MVLGQLRVDEKSNEIPAVPELLDCIDVKNCVITSDAMSCQKKTVRKITEHKCDYVICLKGNQETLHNDVKLYFETAQKEPNFYPLSKTKTLTKDHGRIEKREWFAVQGLSMIWKQSKSDTSYRLLQMLNCLLKLFDSIGALKIPCIGVWICALTKITVV